MKNQYYLILILLVFGKSTCLYAQSPLIQNVATRKTISLDSAWDSQVDVYESGYYLPFGDTKQPNPEGFFTDKKPVKNQYSEKNFRNTELVEYDFDLADKLQVPGDWNTQDPRLLFYEGTIWYRKKFSVIPQAGKRYFLHFGAVNYEAIVYLNGKLVGRHEGGFTAFQFEVTDLLKAGENKVFVHANNSRDEAKIPIDNTDWWNYGGITRSVNLVEVSENYIQDYFIQLEKGKPYDIKGWVRLDGLQKKQSVTIEIPEIGIKQAVQTDTSGYAQIRITSKKLQLWTPDNPKLYHVRLSIASDTVSDKIGFRTIETRGTEILLNGKPIFLKGVCIHEEAPFRSGRCYSEADDYTLLNWAKEMGCNYVRLAHYPHNEMMTRMADQMGLMVWSEIPVYWSVKFEKPEVYANAENQLAENISRDKNRTSIIIWSMANETPETEPRLAFLKKLLLKTRSLDSTRLTSAALFAKLKDGHQSIEDPLGEFVDVMGCNEYIGWYYLPAELAPTIQWSSKFDKPLIISEFGGDAVAGLHGKPDEIWTEEFQNNIYENQVKMFNKIPFLRGTSAWVLMDFRSPKRMLPGKQDFFNRKGLVSDKGIKKSSYCTLQKWYKNK